MQRTALILALGLTAASTAPLHAQNLKATSEAVAEPLREAPLIIVSQPLAGGEVTHQAKVQVGAGEAPVTVRSIQPNAVVGDYRIDFDALDSDRDGYLSRSEAQANPALADEFNALDTARSGRLSREQLAGWLR